MKYLPTRSRIAPAATARGAPDRAGGRDDGRHDVAHGDRASPAIVLVAVHGLLVGDDVAGGPPESPALVDAAEPRVEGLLGHTLKPGVERGVHGEPALVEALGAVPLLEVLPDVLDEKRRECRPWSGGPP